MKSGVVFLYGFFCWGIVVGERCFGVELVLVFLFVIFLWLFSFWVMVLCDLFFCCVVYNCMCGLALLVFFVLVSWYI